MHKNKLMTRLSSLALTGFMILNTPGVVHANEPSAPCTHEHMSENPSADATCTDPGHSTYYQCDDCGKFFKDADGTIETTPEEEETSPLQHTYDMVSYEHDGTQHWHLCSRCGEPSEKENHELSWAYGEDTHYQRCQCGYETSPVAHDFSSDWEYDADFHWHRCECGIMDVYLGPNGTYGAHTFASDGVCTVCGAERHEEPETSKASKTSETSAPSGGSSGGSNQPSATEAAVADIKLAASASTGDQAKPVVIEGNSVSNDVVQALISNPDVIAMVKMDVEGQSVSVNLSDPIIEGPADFYGAKNLIGIHNRGVAYRAAVKMGMDPAAVMDALLRDAANAKLGIAPSFLVPLPVDGDSYIYVLPDGTILSQT